MARQGKGGAHEAWKEHAAAATRRTQAMSTPHRQQHVRLDIDRDGLLPLTKDRLIGTSITILGRKGTGKSTTLAVLAGELLKERGPLVLVDPQAEDYALAQAFDIIVAGRTAQALVSL